MSSPFAENWRQVSDFAPTGSPAQQALEYPFRRVGANFVTLGENGSIVEIPSDTTYGFLEIVDDILEEFKCTGINDRTPVIAYGANANPFRFAQKMNYRGLVVFDDEETPKLSDAVEELPVAPMMRVNVPNTKVVWHGKPSQTGSAFAEIARDETGGSVECYVQWLTDEQIALMHASEGVGYRFAPFVTYAADGTEINAYSYVAQGSSVLLKDGKTISVRAPGEDPKSGSMSAREAVAYMLEHAGDVIGFHDPDELAAANTAKGVKLKEKKERQVHVQERLAELGLSVAFDFGVTETFGRADFDSIHVPGHTPKVHRLLEDIVSRLRPSDVAVNRLAIQVAIERGESELTPEILGIARKRLDPAFALRRKATGEIEADMPRRQAELDTTANEVRAETAYATAHDDIVLREARRRIMDRAAQSAQK